jgi:hypothetical protein
VIVNEEQVYDGIVPCQSWERTFRITESQYHDSLTIRLHSDTFRPAGDPRELGVAVEKLELFTSVLPENQGVNETVRRLPNGPWYRDEVWVREVLLKNADKLRGLYFTGGEPMLEKQVENILEHLIDRRVAPNIFLEFNTNCTVLRDSMLEKLQRFKKVHLALSIDAYGPYYEYIRYPAKWPIIRRNVERLVEISGGTMEFAAECVLQVYNALNLVQVLQWFDEMNIYYRIEIASMPWFLGVSVLPVRARRLAAERLRAYAAGTCRPDTQADVLSIASYLESVEDRSGQDALRTLMLFTNDLDAGRGQCFKVVHSELLSLLEESGFQWTDERCRAAPNMV